MKLRIILVNFVSPDPAAGVLCFIERKKLLFTGRKIAIDASMCLYQFLIAVRAEGMSKSHKEHVHVHRK